MKSVKFSVEINAFEIDQKGINTAIDMAKGQVSQFKVDNFDSVAVTLKDEHVTVNYAVDSTPETEEDDETVIE
jgi:hypothetical protein